METETSHFCVVCVMDSTVYAMPYWEIEAVNRVDTIAAAVACAAGKFGQADFEVRVVEISA